MNSSRLSSLICPVAGQPLDRGHPLGLGEPHLAGEVVQVPHQRGHAARPAAGRGRCAHRSRGEIGDVVLGDELHGVLLGGRRAAVAGRRRGQGVSTSRTPASPVACRRHGGGRPRPAAAPRARRRCRPAAACREDARRAPPRRWSGVSSALLCSRARRRCGCAGRRRRTRRCRRPAPPRLTSRPARRQHPRGRGGRDAEDRVHDDVARPPPARPASRAASASTSSDERDDRVGAGRAARVRRRRPTGRRPTTRPAPSSRASPTADLAHRAAGAQHEHPLPRLQRGPAR